MRESRRIAFYEQLLLFNSEFTTSEANLTTGSLMFVRQASEQQHASSVWVSVCLNTGQLSLFSAIFLSLSQSPETVLSVPFPLSSLLCYIHEVKYFLMSG